ncbi:unnamed protein product [Ilex paraguariensis]|uniref:Uncharacterized protein n=1 Tax=Ilex paraguariensis TaxID=185542 RepID=A0ABC8TR49_9AQUA
MKGKVVLITGASSGIGEQLAYEYGRKGAALVIVARRENKLQKVAERARGLGSPDVLPICANVANVNECKRFVAEGINHFGRLDHLVNNAGVVSVCPVEDAPDTTNFTPIMDVNFWGSVYPTYFAIPYLKKTRGKIVVNSSISAWLHPPTVSFYVASKAALISFYEAMRVELAPEITISMVPMMNCSTCAKSIVEAACQGQRYVIEPKWFSVLIMLKTLCPELVELYYYYRTFHSKP